MGLTIEQQGSVGQRRGRAGALATDVDQCGVDDPTRLPTPRPSISGAGQAPAAAAGGFAQRRVGAPERGGDERLSTRSRGEGPGDSGARRGFRLRGRADACRRAPFIALVLAAWGLARPRRRIGSGTSVAACVVGAIAVAMMLLVPAGTGRIARAVGDLPSSLLLLAAIGLLRGSVPSAGVS